MKVLNAFRKIDDLVHLLFGAMVRILKYYGLSVISLVFFVIFLLYQAVEKEVEVQSYMDYIEFIIGYLLVEVIV